MKRLRRETRKRKSEKSTEKREQPDAAVKQLNLSETKKAGCMGERGKGG